MRFSPLYTPRWSAKQFAPTLYDYIAAWCDIKCTLCESCSALACRLTFWRPFFANLYHTHCLPLLCYLKHPSRALARIYIFNCDDAMLRAFYNRTKCVAIIVWPSVNDIRVVRNGANRENVRFPRLCQFVRRSESTHVPTRFIIVYHQITIYLWFVSNEKIYPKKHRPLCNICFFRYRYQ